MNRIAILAIVLLITLGSAVAGGRNVTTVRQVSLYADVKARAVGDIVTVMIIEKMSGSNSTKLSTKRKDKFAHSGNEGTGLFDFVPDFGLSASFDKSLEGTGQQSRQGRLTAQMAATVSDILPNGDLVIRGEKEVEVNGETEILSLSGTVRPADISAGNVVFSTNIAGAKIAYKGKGVVSKGTSPSLFSRVLSWIF